MGRHELLCKTSWEEWCAHSGQVPLQIGRIKRPRGYIQAHECLIRSQTVHPEQKAVASRLCGPVVQSLPRSNFLNPIISLARDKHNLFILVSNFYHLH